MTRPSYKSRATIAVGLVALSLLCCKRSIKDNVQAKAIWLCQHTDLEQLDPDDFPDGTAASDFLLPEDIAASAELSSEQDIQEFRNQLADADGARDGDAKKAPAASHRIGKLADALASRTHCEIRNIVERENNASVSISQSRPKLGDATGINWVNLGVVVGVTSKSAYDSAVEKLIANSHENENSDHLLDFTKTNEGWRFALRKTRARKELSELEQKLTAAVAARTELAKFAVQRAQLKHGVHAFDQEEPSIELDVKNGTSQPVSEVRFSAKLTTPGRAIPWLKQEFGYSIPGGLQPGERATWHLVPNITTWSDWAAPQRSDTVFEVKTIELHGVDKKTLVADNFSDEDEHRIAELKSIVADTATSPTPSKPKPGQ